MKIKWHKCIGMAFLCTAFAFSVNEPNLVINGMFGFGLGLIVDIWER